MILLTKKRRHDIVIDNFLWEILTHETCKYKNKSRSDLIAELISNNYNIPLTEDYTVGETAKNEYLLSCIDNKIKDLEAKKKDLLERI